MKIRSSVRRRVVKALCEPSKYQFDSDFFTFDWIDLEFCSKRWLYFFFDCYIDMMLETSFGFDKYSCLLNEAEFQKSYSIF